MYVYSYTYSTHTYLVIGLSALNHRPTVMATLIVVLKILVLRSLSSADNVCRSQSFAWNSGSAGVSLVLHRAVCPGFDHACLSLGHNCACSALWLMKTVLKPEINTYSLVRCNRPVTMQKALVWKSSWWELRGHVSTGHSIVEEVETPSLSKLWSVFPKYYITNYYYYCYYLATTTCMDYYMYYDYD